MTSNSFQTPQSLTANAGDRNEQTVSPIYTKMSLLTADQTKELEKAVAGDLTGGMFHLMEMAGEAVAEIVESYASRDDKITVLCGPGANGGDGYIAAGHLVAKGFSVKIIALANIENLTGEAKQAYEAWGNEVVLALDENLPLCQDILGRSDWVVDALFGIGLKRHLDPVAEILLRACETKRIIAVDLPSGVHADTGEVLGYAPIAMATLTFLRPKPGHFLLPGRERCGTLVVRELNADVVRTCETEPGYKPTQWLNDPPLWQHLFRRPAPSDHKFSRGMPLIIGGVALTGAARLAAKAAQRCGVGAVAVAAPIDAQTVYKVTLESALVQPFRDSAALQEQVEDQKVKSVLIGPGMGLVGATRERAAMVARSGKAAVLDADALSVFEGGTELLFESVRGEIVLTPHEGEFARVFPDIQGGRLIRARAASARSGCVVVLKGYDTVVASPDGRVVINANAPPDLAVAGTGDILAGIIVSLLAQGFPAFEAAAAAVWLHGQSASLAGRHMIAEDLIPLLPRAFEAAEPASPE